MRKLLALLCLLAAPAMAQDAPTETIEARDASLSGLWRISVPASIAVNWDQQVHFGPMKDLFCRIDQNGDDLENHCLNGGYAKSGDGTVEGAHVHLAWGMMMARFVIDAVHDGPNLRGTYAIKVAGLRHDAPEPSIGTRIHAVTDDGGTGAALLRQTLEQAARGSVTLPHDAAAVAKNDGGWPKGLAAKGAIAVVARLGMAPRLDHPGEGDFLTVYDVLFEKGELLCGLHQRDDGVLDAFRCV